MPFVRGYKAPFEVKKSNSFQDVVIPFTDFSDNWDPYTGDIKVKCKENSIHCPDEATLRYFTTFSIMGEGKDGIVHVEVKSVDAVDCAFDDGKGGTGSGAWVGILFGILVAGGVGYFAGTRSLGSSKFGGLCSSLKDMFGRRDGVDHSFVSNETGTEVAKIGSPHISSLRGQTDAVYA